MDGAWLHRMRWRRRGAWLWPAFVAMTVFDAVIGHLLPPAGETETIAAAAALALVLNVIALLLLSRPLGALARRARGGLPTVVARDYGGATAVILVGCVVLAVGLVHRPTVLRDQRAMQDAVARAQAWIGFRAPAQFRRNVQFTDTYAIQDGSIYRTCVPNGTGSQTFCVVVKLALPFAQSVSFSGYEPNWLFAQGAN
jgi:hypothetical protein